MADEFVSLEVWDIVIIVVYFVFVMAVGIFATVRANRNTAEGFFLAGRSMTFIPLAGSIYASNIGASMFVGLAGSAAAFGYAPVMFEWHATYTLVLLGWIFVPIYIASGTMTMPEYLQKRFGRKRIRVYYAIIQLIWTAISGISGEIYAGTLFFQQLLGWNIYLSTIVILAITAVYTLGGGLAAVIYTDTVQSGILIIGAMVVSIIALVEIGGYEQMVNQFLGAASNETYLGQALYHNRSCGFPPADSFHIFRGMDSNYPWPGLVFGLTLLATYYWCTNQVIVQRNLSAKTVLHSKAACVVASYLKLLPFFIFVLPGMISRILYPDRIACSSPEECKRVCDNPAGCTNIAYPVLVLTLLPVGVKGLMLAAMLSALMSSLTSQFNSSSSVFVMDLWLYCRKKASQFEIVLVGRLFGLLMIVVSILWLPVIQAIQGGSLWDYLQSVSSYITPPWVVAFVLGMFWSRLTEEGTWWGLMAGLVTGIVRMGVEFSYSVPKCGSGDVDTRPSIITKVHYLMFAIILCSVAFIVMVAISIVTPPRRKNQLHRVLWWTRHDEEIPDLTDYSDNESSCDEEEREKSHKKPGCVRKAYNVVCGATDIIPPKMTAEQKAAHQKAMTNIEEDPIWARVCDINGLAAVAATCFIIGFYA
jgi:sodium/glucose cotransporter 9